MFNLQAFHEIIFSARNCAGQQGSWDISILALDAFGLHARNVLGSRIVKIARKNSVNYT